MEEGSSAIGRGLGSERGVAEALGAVLDRLREGVILVDATGAVLGGNAAGRAILGAGAPLLERHGLLEAADPAVRERLRGFLETLVAGTGAGPEQALALERADGERPLEVVGVPLARPERAPVEGTPAALILLHDPALCRIAGCEALLRQLYRLTPAEARVACTLLDGLGVDEAAARLNLSRHTVRTHVKHVLAKTSARSQTELLRVLLSGPLALLRLSEAARAS